MTPSAAALAPLRIAIVGLGMGMQRAGIVQATPGAELVAVCDRDPARLAEAVTKFGCAGFSDYRELLQAPGIDCIYVMTPTHLHLDGVRAAAAARKHIILTKPMETSLARAEEIRDICAQAGVALVVDHELRYDPVMRQVKSALEAGLLGRILTVEARLQWHRAPEYYRAPRGTWAGDGGGVFTIQAVHLLDQMNWLLGLPTAVDADLATLANNIEVEDYGVIRLNYHEGRLRGVAIASTLYGDDVQFGLILTGTRGSVDTTRALHGFHQRGIEWFFRPGCAAPLPPPPAFPRNAIDDLRLSLLEGTPPQSGPADGIAALRLLAAIYQSAREQRPISL
jgi:UDP-N-acetyl-2-amino-2-deoxyglucuronate dehydrogenase